VHSRAYIFNFKNWLSGNKAVQKTVFMHGFYCRLQMVTFAGNKNQLNVALVQLHERSEGGGTKAIARSDGFTF